MNKDYNLDIFVPETQVGELIRVDIILASGQQMTIIDEFKSTVIKETLFEIIIKGRYNYARLLKRNLGAVRFSVTLPKNKVMEKQPDEG